MFFILFKTLKNKRKRFSACRSSSSHSGTSTRVKTIIWTTRLSSLSLQYHSWLVLFFYHYRYADLLVSLKRTCVYQRLLVYVFSFIYCKKLTLDIIFYKSLFYWKIIKFIIYDASQINYTFFCFKFLIGMVLLILVELSFVFLIYAYKKEVKLYIFLNY